MSALSLTIYKIFANQIKFQKFDLENESQCQEGEKRDLRHSIGNVRFITGEFSELYLPANKRLRKLITHTDININQSIFNL